MKFTARSRATSFSRALVFTLAALRPPAVEVRRGRGAAGDEAQPCDPGQAVPGISHIGCTGRPRNEGRDGKGGAPAQTNPRGPPGRQ